MKKLLFGTMLLMLLAVVPASTRADVHVHIGIPLPPAIVFSAPPVMVVIPETYIYAVPDVPEDLFFYGGWWWRPWEGRWYRSHHYDSGWARYQGTPAFYANISPRWREDYREHHWKGHPWKHQKVPARQLQGNWSSWEKKKHWERQQHWGVPDLKSRKSSHQPSRSIHQPRSQPQSRELNRHPPRPVPREMNHPQRRPESREMNAPQPRQEPKGISRSPSPDQNRERKENHRNSAKGKHGKGEKGNGHKNGRN